MAVGKRVGKPITRQSKCSDCGADIECTGTKKAGETDICEECDYADRIRREFKDRIKPEHYPQIPSTPPTSPWRRPWGPYGPNWAGGGSTYSMSN